MLHKWQIHSSVSRDGGRRRAFSVGHHRLGGGSSVLEGGRSAHVDPGVAVGSGGRVRPRPGLVHLGGLALRLAEGGPMQQQLPRRRLPGRQQRRSGPLQRHGADRGSSLRHGALTLPVCPRDEKKNKAVLTRSAAVAAGRFTPEQAANRSAASLFVSQRGVKEKRKADSLKPHTTTTATTGGKCSKWPASLCHRAGEDGDTPT